MLLYNIDYEKLISEMIVINNDRRLFAGAIVKILRKNTGQTRITREDLHTILLVVLDICDNNQLNGRLKELIDHDFII